MPVTAKLSRKFYERLGDDVADELVDWFNAVDSTYQTQLREINELNWERFKTELHAQGAMFSAELQAQGARFSAELQAQGARFSAELQAQGVELRAEMNAMAAQLRAEMHVGFAELRKEMAQLESRLMRWMFVYWSGMMATQAALLWAILSR